MRRANPIVLLLVAAACTAGDDGEEKFYSEPPKLVNEAEVDSLRAAMYPSELKARGITGTAEVGVFVTADGRLTRMRVAKSSDISELDSAAVKVARRMKWQPAKKGEKTVGAYIRFPVVFGGS